MIESTNNNKIFSDDLPVVSVCVQTYQQVNYIEECLDSILSQITDFPFEIILGEDESSDGTREICIRYAERFPKRIKLFLRSRKDVILYKGKATGRFNFIENIKAASGKFIALCEGDDYWTDNSKLQKQFDLLMTNNNYGICFHKVLEMNTFNNKNKYLPSINSDKEYNIFDYIQSNDTATCSMFFRRDLFFPIPEWMYKVPFGDLGIILLILHKTSSTCMVLKDEMGVYRINSGGIHGSMKKNSKTLIRAYYQHIDFFNIIKKELLDDNKYDQVLRQKIIDLYITIKNHYIEDKIWLKSLLVAIQIVGLKLFFKLNLK